MKPALALVAAALLLAGCGEKPQTAGTEKKTDDKPWDARGSEFAAGGWKSGDQASWEAQLRARAQGQNEYTRSTPAASN